MALALTALLAAGCGRGDLDGQQPQASPGGIRASASSFDLRTDQFHGGGLELPRDQDLLDPLTFGPAELDGGRSWAHMLGKQGHFRLALPASRGGELRILARALPLLEAPQTVELLIEGHSLGEFPLAKQATELAFQLPEDQAALGVREFELRCAETVRPMDVMPGSMDPRALGIDLCSVAFRSNDAPAPSANSRAWVTRFYADGAGQLTWELSSSKPTRVDCWIKDLASGEVNAVESLELGPTAQGVNPDLSRYVGRIVEIGILVDDASALKVQGPSVQGAIIRDNLIWIVVDTLRADRFIDALDGHPLPAFARLRRDGISFANAVAHAPMTLPSHTSMFASRLPQETQVTNNWQDVPLDLPLVAEWLSSAGFSTHGLMSLGTLYSSLPGQLLTRGFDSCFTVGEIRRAEWMNKKVQSLLRASADSRQNFLFFHYSDPHEPYNTTRFPERKATIELPGMKPFELGLSTWSRATRQLNLAPGEYHFNCHSEVEFIVRRMRFLSGKDFLPVQWTAGEPYGSGFLFEGSFTVPPGAKRSIEAEVWVYDLPQTEEIPSRYDEEVRYANQHLERVLQLLDDTGLYDSSLLVFTSDHGEALGEHNNYFGHARTLYDEELRVPILIKLPQGDRRSKLLEAHAHDLVSHVNLTPTLLELLGLPPLPGSKGLSLLKASPVDVFAETHQPESPEDLFSLRNLEFKLIYAPAAERFELYDLQKDPGELTNLFESRGGEFEAWQERLRKYAAGQAERSAVLSLEQIDRLRGLGYVLGR